MLRPRAVAALRIALAAAAALPWVAACGQARSGENPPWAEFTARSRAAEGDLVLFDASPSRDTGERPGLLSYFEFDFGDGTARIRSAWATPVAQHAYDKAAEYTVRLTMVDDLGNSGEAVHTVEIVEDYVPCQPAAVCPDPACCDADSRCDDGECWIVPAPPPAAAP